jgi:hypothetical protein
VNLLEFIAQLVESLAWPIAVVILILVFRHRVGDLLRSLHARMSDLKEINGPGGFSAKFAEEVGKVNEDIKEELPPPAHRPAIGDGASASAEPSQHADRWDYDRMRRLAVVSPRGATLEAFLVLESTIFEAAQSWGVDSRSYNQRSARQALRALELPPQLARPIQRLIDLRNEAVHARELRGHAGSCYRLHRRRSRRS